jgi:four helix bundle protein
LRRASSAIGDAISEGAGKATQRDFAHYLMNGVGSTSEVESRLHLALRLRLLP